MKKKVIIAINILIIMFAVLFAFGTISKGKTAVVDGITWYYEEKNGEAVNVYVYSGVNQLGSSVTIPSQLGGLPVTSIGRSSGGRNIFGYTEDDYQYDIKEITIPDTVETINDYAFIRCSGLKKIIIPDSVKSIGDSAFSRCVNLRNVDFGASLERIGYMAFESCSLEKIELNNSLEIIELQAFNDCTRLEEIDFGNSVQVIGYAAFQNCYNLHKVKIPNSVKEIGEYAFNLCKDSGDIYLSNNVEKIYETSFYGFTNVYIDKEKENVDVIKYSDNPNDYSEGLRMPYIHYKNETHKISAELIEGIKLINVATNEEITQADLACGSDVTIKLEKSEGYEYEFLNIQIRTQGKYKTNKEVIETSSWKLNQEYTFTNLDRNKVIKVENLDGSQVDLSLRQYIDSINNEKLTQAREPVVNIVDGNFEYKHTKQAVDVKRGDRIVYKIRVYNEGTTDGRANEIAQYLPQGLEFDAGSEINSRYGWKISEDGRVATTEYLVSQKIPAYKEGSNNNYKEISIACIVNLENEEKDRRLVSLAEITAESSKDIDSIPGNIGPGVNSEYMLEESKNSNNTSYIVGIEDDNDFENINVLVESDEIDLSLRQYIDTINNNKLTESREPNVQKVDGKIKYQHSKKTVYINQGDTIVYNIRVYNEGTVDGTANKITEFLPEGIEFKEESVINLRYGWEISEDGRVATTEYLATQNIPAYEGGNNVNYKELSIECIVNIKDEKQSKRLVNIAEITEASKIDLDSIPGNIARGVESNYMLKEGEDSDSASYIVGIEDDNDFESINTQNNATAEYAIRIHKIDDLTNELLNGAKFALLNENREVIQTGVTANGGILDFGMKETVGEGKDIYYVKEISTPPGYRNTLKYTLKIVVKKEFVSESELQTTIEADVEDIDIDTGKYKEIPIYTKEQLRKIGNNEEVYIEQADATYKFDNTKRYTLMQDIDLQSENWTPIEGVENVMLDGNNHKISNLKIENTNADTKKFGLFSTYSGIIENLTLDNVDIDITKEDDTEQVTEEDINAVGGIVGYLETGILKNCRVTGEINASVDNVGGLVGHTKESSLTVFRDCTNEANVTIEGNNAGGLLGCSLGAVNVANSQNKGQISITLHKRSEYWSGYNAAGLIGCADPKGHTPNFVQVGYDSESKVVQVVVKNEIISGKYNLRLEKVDESEQANLLNGAKFNLYDSNKNVIEEYKNVTFKDGVLELPKTINSLGEDIYYLKEVEAPEGYAKLSEDYIKVEIQKEWDYEKEEYKVSAAKTSVLSEEEFNEDKVNKEDEVGSGQIYNGTLEGATWKVDKVTILENSKNLGRVHSGYRNAAGLLGRAKANVRIEESINSGEIVANGRAAGLVAELQQEDEELELYVNNCANNGEIKQVPEDIEVGGDSSSGLIGSVESNVEMHNSNNNANITTNNKCIGGIVGVTASNKVVIDNCQNNGTLEVKKINFSSNNNNDSGNGIVGGIIAKNWTYTNDGTSSGNKYTETKISNCNNTGDINSADAHSGGIVGYSIIKKIEIENCKTENTTINAINAGIGGIAGTLRVPEVYINNCESNNNIFDLTKSSSYNNSASKSGGIVGSIYENYGDKGNIEIDNCKVNNVEIHALTDSAGILGFTNREGNLKVSNCSVINSKINIDVKEEISRKYIKSLYFSCWNSFSSMAIR